MKIELSEILELNANMILKANMKNAELEKKNFQRKITNERLMNLNVDYEEAIGSAAREYGAKQKEIEILKHALVATENTIENYDIFLKTINEIIADSKNSSLKSKLLCEIEEYDLEDMIFDNEINGEVK